MGHFYGIGRKSPKWLCPTRSVHYFLVLKKLCGALSCKSLELQGVREEVLPAFFAASRSPIEMNGKYALGMKSSDGFVHSPSSAMSASTAVFIPQAYSRHLGTELKSLAYPGPVAMVSDRAPDAVVERRRRRFTHRLLMSDRAKAFNRTVRWRRGGK
jgi:hypothetical protein